MGIKERKEREKERRRQQIIVAAKRVFSRKGYTKTTMEDIATEAELSPGTLYLYFKSKDELYASLCLRVLQFMNMKIEHVNSDANMAYGDRLDALMKAMWDIYEFDPLILNNVFHLQSSETLLNLTPDLLKEITDLSRKSLQGMAQVFKRGIEAETVIECHPFVLADIFWSLFSGTVLWEETKKITSEERFNLEQNIKTAFEIFKRGVLAEAG